MTGAGKGGISPDGRACHGILKAAMTFKSPGLGMKGSLFVHRMTVSEAALPHGQLPAV